MSEEILSLIKSSNRENAEKKQLKKKAVWLIFTIGNQADGKNLYAIPADSVKEILRDATVFPLPFVPPYVNGVLNRYGDPYVVIDSAVLEGKEAQQCRWAARDILRNLIVHIRVSQSHYYLVKDLYELLYKAYDELMSCRNVYCNKCLSGNYEGTEVTLRVIYQEGDNDPARKSRLIR